MGEAKVVILCQSGQEDECRPLAETLRTMLTNALGVSAVVVGTGWKKAGSQDAISYYDFIAKSAVIVSIFAAHVANPPNPEYVFL